MSIFNRAKKIASSYLDKDHDKMKKIRKDMDQMIKDLKVKEDAIKINIHRIDQEILHQEELIEKYTLYEEDAESPSESKRFALQKEQTQQTVYELQDKKINLEHTLLPFQKMQESLDSSYKERSASMQALQQEALTKQKEAQITAQLNQYEDKIRRDLAEAEALLEIKKRSL